MNPDEIIKAFIGFCFALILMWMALDIITKLKKGDKSWHEFIMKLLLCD